MRNTHDDKENWSAGRVVRRADFAKRGMEILLRNYYTPYGEIDLIVRDGGYIAFVEVKTRRAGSLVRPAEAVDRRQAKKDHPVGCILPDGASRRSAAKI